MPVSSVGFNQNGPTLQGPRHVVFRVVGSWGKILWDGGNSQDAVVVR